MIRKNKIIILISIIVIIGAFLIFYNIQNQSSQAPKISFSEEEWDFGKIKDDEKSVHIFTIKNIGRKELIISRAQASCGCTATMLSSDHIAPGKSAELEVTFNPAGFKGVVKKNIYIESNDPRLPQTNLTIIAEVETIPSPQVYSSNSQWDFGLISQGDLPTFAFTIENKGELNLVIEKIEGIEYVKYDVELPLNILPGEKKDINFTYDSTQHALGEVRERIRLFCNDPRKEIFSLRIIGNIQEGPNPSVSISPIGASFSLLNSAEGEVMRSFTLTNTGTEKVKITSVKTLADYFIPIKSEGGN